MEPWPFPARARVSRRLPAQVRLRALEPEHEKINETGIIMTNYSRLAPQALKTCTAVLASVTLFAIAAGPADASPVNAATQGTKAARSILSAELTHVHAERHRYRYRYRTEHEHRIVKRHRHNDVEVDAPTTYVRTRRGHVVVDAPFTSVERSRHGVRVRAPFVDLWVPRR